MRELTPQEAGLLADRLAEDFWSLGRYKSPPWEELPIHAVPRLEGPPETTPADPPEPIPLHWLPPCEDWPAII